MDHDENWLEDSKRSTQGKDWVEIDLNKTDETLEKFTRNFNAPKNQKMSEDVSVYSDKNTGINLNGSQIFLISDLNVNISCIIFIIK